MTQDLFEREIKIKLKVPESDLQKYYYVRITPKDVELNIGMNTGNDVDTGDYLISDTGYNKI